MGEIIYASHRSNGEKTRFCVLPSFGFNPDRPSYMVCEIVDFGYDLRVRAYGNTVQEAIDSDMIMFYYELTVVHETEIIKLFNSPIILHEQID